MAETPTLTRRQLGVKLRKWRNRSGLSLDDIEVADIMSIPKMYKLEGGKSPKPSWPEIQELAKLYGAPADEVKELARMAKACLVSGWYVPFDVPQQFQTYLDLEGAASRLRFYENEYVNGLFQVEPYIRAVQESGGLIGEQADPHVRFRTQRINRFWGRKPLPVVDLVMSEGALRRIVGGPEAMAAQVGHLRELDAGPQVSIFIVPFSAGPHPSMEGKYTIMEFNRDEYPKVVYLESRSECQYHERLAVLALYERSWTETLKLAVPMKEFEL
ncbi:helix-turn-helix domain-containing protein [Phytomonospora endophytica]|uniref:Transcriptional regulator with XRE-family HTH domain n=2 Tax=Phytomonospora endophytica TaxID=714109 RepID=A0A841G192_9ACTN|nr:helix-turn-helix transcriptional regulator [Phytomonospora endophytica]MBB6039522.1 transcriptional regulator with XRE-family HTH domain [Phytomonospora endophytica]